MYLKILHTFARTSQENNAPRAGNIWKHVMNPRNIVFAAKMILNLSGKLFASGEENFVSATILELGAIDRKQNVSATMFPSLPRAYDWYVIDEVILHQEIDPNYTKTTHTK